MRTDVKWTVAIGTCIAIGLKVVSYLPKDSNKGNIVCEVAGGKITTHIRYSGNKLPIFKEGDKLLTCIIDGNLAIIDEEGKYLCGMDDDGIELECYDLATDKRVL